MLIIKCQCRFVVSAGRVPPSEAVVPSLLLRFLLFCSYLRKYGVDSLKCTFRILRIDPPAEESIHTYLVLALIKSLLKLQMRVLPAILSHL